MNRSKKSLYNIFFGVGNQIITLIIGLIIPRLFILNYGSEVNGLQSSIAYIYTYIALLESGIGTATIQALFGALGRSNKAEVNSILAATNLQYKRVAKAYFACMLAFAVVYPLTVSTTIDPLIISGVIVLSGISSLISFWTYGKFVLLLQSDGCSYIVSSVGLVHYILNNIIKITLIMLGASFIYVYVGSAFVSLVTFGFYRIYQRKKYSWVDYLVEPKMETISQSKNVLVHQVASIVCNSTDVLVLTYFVRNLKLVSIYNVYIMIFDAVKSLILNVFSSVNFIMGQTYHKDIVLYRKYHHIYEVMDIAVSFTMYSIAYIMMTPFLEVYTKGISDISYIDKYLPLLFAMTKLLTSAREPASQLINYAGHFKKTQNRAIIETIINVIVSIVASYFLGIYGVLLGTIVALGYRTIDMYLYTSRRFLDRSVWVSIKQWIVYMSAFAIIMYVSGKLEIHATSYIDFFAKAFVVGTVVAVFYVVYSCIFNLDVVMAVGKMAKNKIQRK